jgi:glucoamylase
MQSPDETTEHSSPPEQGASSGYSDTSTMKSENTFTSEDSKLDSSSITAPSSEKQSEKPTTSTQTADLISVQPEPTRRLVDKSSSTDVPAEQTNAESTFESTTAELDRKSNAGNGSEMSETRISGSADSKTETFSTPQVKIESTESSELPIPSPPTTAASTPSESPATTVTEVIATDDGNRVESSEASTHLATPQPVSNSNDANVNATSGLETSTETGGALNPSSGNVPESTVQDPSDSSQTSTAAAGGGGGQGLETGSPSPRSEATAPAETTGQSAETGDESVAHVKTTMTSSQHEESAPKETSGTSTPLPVTDTAQTETSSPASNATNQATETKNQGSIMLKSISEESFFRQIFILELWLKYHSNSVDKCLAIVGNNTLLK